MQSDGASLMGIHPRPSPGFVSGGRRRSADELGENALRAMGVLAAAGVEAVDGVAVMLRHDSASSTICAEG
jgi:hypothetical protein